MFFFFPAEDGIRDADVTGVQTCALPISLASSQQRDRVVDYIRLGVAEGATLVAGGPDSPDGLDKGYFVQATVFGNVDRSEERRVGKECRCGCWWCHQ